MFLVCLIVRFPEGVDERAAGAILTFKVLLVMDNYNNININNQNFSDDLKRSQCRGGAPVTPLRPQPLTQGALCLEVSAALRDPAVRPLALRRGVLPVNVAQALRMLDDVEFKEAAAGLRALKARRAAGETDLVPMERERSRALFRSLQDRFPEVMFALRAARREGLGAGKGDPRFPGLQDVVVVIMGEVSENPFEALDLAD